MLHRLARAILALGLVAWFSPAAWAQDDWSVRRDPFDQGTVRRYKAILARNPHDASALSRLAQMYRRHRTIDKLIGEYQANVDRAPTDHSALVVLARLHGDIGKPDEAIALFEKALSARPGDAETSLVLGDMYWRKGDAAGSRNVYERALAAKPAAAIEKSILHKLFSIAESTGDIAGAEAYFARYIALAPGDVQARLELGDALLKHQKHARAITIFKEAESRLHGDPARRIEVIARLGSAYEGAGDESAAIREYRRAISMSRPGFYIEKELTARIIDIHRRQQTLDELVRYYDKQWPAARRGHFEWETMAHLYEEIGDQEKAVAAYRRATKKAPHELDTHRRLIRLLETTGREDDALAQYEIAIRVAPGEPRFQIELAERYYRRGKRQKALALLHKLEARFGSDAGVHSALADMYSRWGEEELALKAHARLTRIEPNEVVHLVNLGEQYFQRGDRKKAVATWKRIVSRRSPENLARLGRVYSEHDMTEPALDMYGKAIRLQAKDPELYRGRAAVHERKKDWRRAVDDWQKAYDLTDATPGNKGARAEARRRIVALLKRSGHRALSSRMVGWRQRFAASDTDSGYFLVEAYLREGRTSDARRTLEQLRTLAPDDDEVLLQLTKVYRLEQRYDDAVAVLLELAKRIPGRERDFYNQIAELKTRLNKDDEAIFYAQKALEKSPKDPVAYEQLAERYLEMQQYDKAIGALEKTIELAPRDFKSYFALAQLYRNTHRLGEAAELYRRILKRSTDDDMLFKAGRQAIDLEELTGTLGELERVVSPLAFAFGHKDVYRQVLVELYDRYVPNLVQQARSASTKLREQAVAELERLGTHGLKPLLEALADERDEGQRRIAVSVLGYLGNRGAAAPLVHLARQEVQQTASPRLRTLGTTELEWDLRISALVAAGRLADPRTIADLLDLTQHPEVAMREAAIFALGMTRDRRAVQPLLQSLSDRRESVQALACLGLAHVGESRATKALVDVVNDREREDSVRAACAYALGIIGDRQAEASLAKVLGEGNDETQRLAAWALGRLGVRAAMPDLLGAYFGRRATLREAIAWALPRAAAGKRTASKPLAFMDYPTRSGKFDIARAIAELPGPLEDPAIPAQLLVDHRNEVIAALSATLTRHRDLVHRVLAELDDDPTHLSLGALTHGHDLGSAALAPTLEEIGAAIVPHLVELARHPDPLVRRQALSVLAKIGSHDVIAPLEAALEADSLDHRLAAMEAIAPLMRKSGPNAQRLVAQVRQHLDAKDWREQVGAANALGLYGKGTDPMALMSAAVDPQRKAFVRQAAATALGKVGQASAVPTLAKAARDPSRAVQEQAVLALRAIGGPAAKAALQAISKDRRVSPGARALARSGD